MNDNELSERLQAIEEVLKLLMVNSVLNESEMDRLHRETLDKVKMLLKPFGFKSLRLNYMEGEYFIFANSSSKDSASDIRKKYFAAQEALSGEKLVLVFDKLNGKTRKAIEDSEISYYVVDDVLKIFDM